MLEYLASAPWVWGLGGAVCYAAPKFSACLYQCRQADCTWRWCTLEAFISLLCGTLGAAMLTPWGAEIVGANQPHKLPAVAGVIGYLLNPMAPGLLEAFSGRIFAKIKSGDSDGKV